MTAGIRARLEELERSGLEPRSGELLVVLCWLVKAAAEQGLYLMTHWNVIMVCPPLTITREELDEGISILDDVLSIADEYYAG